MNDQIKLVAILHNVQETKPHDWVSLSYVYKVWGCDQHKRGPNDLSVFDFIALQRSFLISEGLQEIGNSSGYNQKHGQYDKDFKITSICPQSIKYVLYRFVDVSPLNFDASQFWCKKRNQNKANIMNVEEYLQLDNSKLKYLHKILFNR